MLSLRLHLPAERDHQAGLPPAGQQHIGPRRLPPPSAPSARQHHPNSPTIIVFLTTPWNWRRQPKRNQRNPRKCSDERGEGAISERKDGSRPKRRSTRRREQQRYKAVQYVRRQGRTLDLEAHSTRWHTPTEHLVAVTACHPLVRQTRRWRLVVLSILAFLAFNLMRC